MYVQGPDGFSVLINDGEHRNVTVLHKTKCVDSKIARDAQRWRVCLCLRSGDFSAYLVAFPHPVDDYSAFAPIEAIDSF